MGREWEVEGEGTGSTGALAAADVNVMFAPVARTQQHWQPVRPGEGGEGWEAESQGASTPQEPMLIFASGPVAHSQPSHEE